MYNNCHLKIEEEGERNRHGRIKEGRSQTIVSGERVLWLPAVSSSRFFFMTKGQKVTRFPSWMDKPSMRRSETFPTSTKGMREGIFSLWMGKKGPTPCCLPQSSHSLLHRGRTDHFSLFRLIFFHSSLFLL